MVSRWTSCDLAVIYNWSKVCKETELEKYQYRRSCGHVRPNLGLEEALGATCIALAGLRMYCVHMYNSTRPIQPFRF